MKLDKKTLKWCARLMDEAAEECEMSVNQGWDSTAIASKSECLSRAMVFRQMAEEIRKGKK